MQQLKYIEETVQHALRQDIGDGDLTASLLPDDSVSKTRVITREQAVICGTQWFDTVYRQIDKRVLITWNVKDGDRVEPDTELCRLEGLTQPILTGERAALNFLQTLSGTATSVHEYAKLLQGTHTKLLDTRKTIPGLRHAQKYAVKTGGGHNHRMGLFDGILLKENHINAAGSITAAIKEAKRRYPKITVEVEVENLKQLQESIDAEVDVVMLDNFSNDLLKEAVELTKGRIRLEASGGYDKDNLRDAALTGVDFISVGALTKHINAIDLSMRFID